MLILLTVSGGTRPRIHRHKPNLPLDAHNKDELRLSRNVDLAALGLLAGEASLLALRIAVLLDVALGTLEDCGALLLVVLRSLSVTNSYHCVVIIVEIKAQSDPKEGDK